MIFLAILVGALLAIWVRARPESDSAVVAVATAGAWLLGLAVVGIQLTIDHEVSFIAWGIGIGWLVAGTLMALSSRRSPPTITRLRVGAGIITLGASMVLSYLSPFGFIVGIAMLAASRRPNSTPRPAPSGGPP